MTYEQWIKKQVDSGWKPPILPYKIIEMKAWKAREDWLNNR